ncbi:craniofacial development protein 1 isoform X1 [Euwallacea similis]|uniref:craniofacial development protein 1 isoform X1 n=1 Tax=Euwallacea similis TaxID=1736056 RepID=UPI0034500C64
MNQEEFPEDSDSSDEDYVPDSKVEDAVSEEESDGIAEDHLSGSDSECKGKKRSKKTKKAPKKKKVAIETNIVFVAEPSEQKMVVNAVDDKKKADDLWADFMKDTGFKSRTSQAVPSTNSSQIPTKNKLEASQTISKADTNLAQNSTVKVTQIFEFAGEEVRVEKEVSSTSAEARLLSQSTAKAPAKKSGSLGGIGSVLSQLGKKQKISTLEKSKLDWDRFKKEEDIEEELEMHNKGKNGYLERQDFLQRADLRRFEIEKEIRNAERAKRFNST